MEDPFLTAASAANWIPSALTVIKDIFNGPTSHFAVPGVMAGGPRRRTIRQLLRKSDIDVWGMLYSPDLSMLMFSVRARQAWRAYQVLERAGIPIIQAPSDINIPSDRKRSGKPMRKSKKKPSSDSLLDQLFNFLDWLDTRT